MHKMQILVLLWYAGGMERAFAGKIRAWLKEKDRKPLVIRGARQVGKSTLVRMVAESEKRHLLEVNLERFPHLDSVFASLDVPLILDTLQSLPRVGQLQQDSILFLDEIQATPHSLQALRYLYEERPDIPVVAAGSLLEFTLAEHQFSMPVGRIRYLHLGPLSFSEFLKALGEESLLKTLEGMTVDSPPSPVQHESLLTLFHTYSLVGGMPAVVADFKEHQSLARCRDLQLDLMDTYRDDFGKYGLKQDTVKLSQVLEKSVLNLGKKIKFSDLLPGEQARTTRRILTLLIKAKLFTQVLHSDGNGLPLSAEADDRIFKLIFLDVGLFNAIRATPPTISGKNRDLLGVHNGVVAEQIVAQEVMASSPLHYRSDLYYWLREKRQGNAEVDFLVGLYGEVVPLEVKSGRQGSMRALKNFAGLKNSPVSVRFDQNNLSLAQLRMSEQNQDKNQTTNSTIPFLSVPLYAASQLERLVTAIMLLP